MDVARPVSWAAATWVAPVVPAMVFLVLVLVGSSDADGGQTTDFLLALGVSVAVAAVGAAMSRVGQPVARGVGWGMLAGAVPCAVSAVWVLLT